MNWEETILHFQSRADCREMMLNTYLDSDLPGNAERFYSSEEFKATKALIDEFHTGGIKLADVGAGTGIASIAFARAGYDVYAIEPDPSKVTGRGAITLLKEHYRLDNPTVLEGLGEKMPLPDGSMDIIYIRQAVHHANNLKDFAKECLRVLRPGGLLIAVREHVIFGRQDKKRFLQTHPMHAHYGGENAYTTEQYLSSFTVAGSYALKVLRHFDSPINYFPRTKAELEQLPEITEARIGQRALELFGPLAKNAIVQAIYKSYIHLRTGGPFDERRIPGRMYSFIFRKNQ